MLRKQLSFPDYVLRMIALTPEGEPQPTYPQLYGRALSNRLGVPVTRINGRLHIWEDDVLASAETLWPGRSAACATGARAERVAEEVVV